MYERIAKKNIIEKYKSAKKIVCQDRVEMKIICINRGARISARISARRMYALQIKIKYKI